MKKEFERLKGLEQLLFKDHDLLKARKKLLESINDSIPVSHHAKEVAGSR